MEGNPWSRVARPFQGGEDEGRYAAKGRLRIVECACTTVRCKSCEFLGSPFPNYVCEYRMRDMLPIAPESGLASRG